MAEAVKCHQSRTYLALLEFDNPYFTPELAKHWANWVIPGFIRTIFSLQMKLNDIEGASTALELLLIDFLNLQKTCTHAIEYNHTVSVIFEGYYHTNMYSEVSQNIAEIMCENMGFLDMTNADVAGIYSRLLRTSNEIYNIEISMDDDLHEMRKKEYHEARCRAICI